MSNLPKARGILSYVASLRRQKKIVKALDNFYKKVGYTNPTSYSVRLGNISSGTIPEDDFISLLTTVPTIKDKVVWLFNRKYYTSPNYQLHRRSKAERLYKECLSSGYILPVTDKVLDEARNQYIEVRHGIKVSEAGSDLLHPLGFLEEVLTKYPLTWKATGKGVVWATTVLTSSTVGSYFLIKLIQHLLHL